MGMLHAGQLSLVKRARDENGCVVVSCFANPHEFSALDEGDHGASATSRATWRCWSGRSPTSSSAPTSASLYPPTT